MPNPRAIPLAEYNMREQLEMLTSAVNNYATGQEVGHQPNPSCMEDRNALYLHWINNGGREEFRTRFRIQVPVRVRLLSAIKGLIPRTKRVLKGILTIEAGCGLKRLVHA